MIGHTEHPDALTDGPVRGRGVQSNPKNRFESVRLHVLGDYLDHVAEQRRELPDGRQVATQVYRDTSRSMINHVDSPDVGLKWTLNPYRGCEHGCVYCYARPTHEMLGMSSGLDFETKIMAKLDAPQRLREELARPKWKGEPILLSGVTDPYQPIESKLEITRRCLELFAQCRQPVGIVTKSRLVLRDLDLLTDLARRGGARVAVSVTTLDNRLASRLEPRAASPSDRLWTIRRLASAGVPVTAMLAPMIPGLNDREIPTILKAVADAGAARASYVLLRLPHEVKALFGDWLQRHAPERRSHVETLIRQSRGGKLYDAKWGQRFKGSGPYAEHIGQMFRVFAARHGLNQNLPPLNSMDFRRPPDKAQMSLFES